MNNLLRGHCRLWPAFLVLTLTLVALTVSTPSLAQRKARGPSPQWRGDISRFHEHDWNIWRGGHWNQGRHDGRWGWWWVVGASWYFYPGPVYPYPNPWEPPVVLVNPPTGTIAPPPTQYWYYCEAAQAYYPYVSSCSAGWIPVPAQPGSAAQTP
jgi:hypothetical protein